MARDKPNWSSGDFAVTSQQTVHSSTFEPALHDIPYRVPRLQPRT